MSYVWINEIVPRNINDYHWLTIKDLSGTSDTYPMPCLYSASDGCWIDFSGNRIDTSQIVAITPIHKPLPYTTLGNGMGYYIRATGIDDVTIYGFGLQPVLWSSRGYRNEKSAREAAKRLMLLDKKDHYNRYYEVIDGKGKTYGKPVTQ